MFKMNHGDNEMNNDEREFHNLSVEESDMIKNQGNLEIHKIHKIEDRVQCMFCNEYANPGGLFCECGKLLPGISEDARIRSLSLRTTSLSGVAADPEEETTATRSMPERTTTGKGRDSSI